MTKYGLKFEGEHYYYLVGELAQAFFKDLTVIYFKEGRFILHTKSDDFDKENMKRLIKCLNFLQEIKTVDPEMVLL